MLKAKTTKKKTCQPKTKPLKIFSCSHEGKYVFGMSVIAATSKSVAKKLLAKELAKQKLSCDEMIMEELDCSVPGVHMLFDGIY